MSIMIIYLSQIISHIVPVFLSMAVVVGEVFPDMETFPAIPNMSWLLLMVEFISSTTAPPES